MTENINELMAAIGRVQAKLPVMPMDGYNPYFDSRYTTFGTVLETLMPIAREEGLVIIQPAVSENGAVGVETSVFHIKSGQHTSFRIVVPVEGKNLGQETGKLITYLRRYSVTAFFMMYSDEDIDANSSEQQKNKDEESGEGNKESGESDEGEKQSVESIIKTFWNPLAKLAEKMKIEFEPLPPNPTEDEVEKAYLDLQAKIEGAK